jgi:beta-fructofuranosidase
MNDPNGPIFWKGKYHLFYQLNPHAAVWGDMHWGHAVSADMVHWKHQPIAMAPTPGGADSEGCFSGSAVVFNGKPAFIYTGVQNAPREQATIRDGSDKLRETQMLAVAEDDELLRWKKVEQPVIPWPPPGVQVTGFRDPCPWKEADGWYLGVGSGERGKGGCVLLYRSPDLQHWEYLHKLVEGKPNGKQAANPCDSGEMWECPDFFALGDKHCLIYSTENKVLWTTGHYDQHAHTYTPERSGVLDHGASYYAPKSFAAPGGRRILWGWLRETRPDAEFAAAGWSGVMSYPRVLTMGAQGQLEMRVAKEVEGLRGPVESAKVSEGAPIRQKLDELRRELFVRINLLSDTVTTVRLISAGQPAWELTIDVPGKAVRCGEIEFPFPGLPWPHPDLRVFLDGSVIESFIGGREALTSRAYGLRPGETELEVNVKGKGHVELQTWPLKAISTDRLTS